MNRTEDFSELYRRHAPTVFRRARQLLGSESDAQEIVQELFLSLYERPEQYSGRSSMVTFLYGATTHACLNRLRDGRNRLRLVKERYVPQENARVEPSPEMRLLLRQALGTLPRDLAEALVYYVVDGMSQQEIAEVRGCSRRHVGDLLARLERAGKEESSCQELPQDKTVSRI